jgi:7,8-dihydropterin-6-yl-methyl-4-(beta-D-ribofuranosyl)aminobenzene 5'-phosphate synthase
MLKITTLLENSTVRHNLLSQHGQSLLIDLDGTKILFDVGEIYEGFIYNLERMQLGINDISIICISHRHIDHMGSLPKLLPLLKTQRLLLPTQMGVPDLKKPGPKYIFMDDGGTETYNVAATPEVAALLSAYPYAEIVDQPNEILPNLWSTGCVGTKMEEQALVYDQKELGLTIIVGCSHPGLATFVERAKEITGNTKVRAILGGFHFNPLSDTEVIEQAHYFETLNLECLMPNHCTGVKQTDILRQHLPDKVKISKTYSVGTGNSVSIGETVEFDMV